MYEPHFLPLLREGILGCPGVSFGLEHKHAEVDPQAESTDPLHIHPYLEIFLNINSDVSFLVNHRLYPVAPGEMVISRPNEVHMGVFHQAGVQEYICLWIQADAASPLLAFTHPPHFFPVFSPDANNKKIITDCLLRLAALCQENGNELKKAACLLQVLALLEPPCDAGAEITLPVPMQNILDDIHRRLDQLHTVNEICAAHFVSPATLNRWFRKYMHLSPREYLESRKLSYAAACLSAGETVMDACSKAGFSDCSHFIALFKKKFGETPLKYKKRLENSSS